jgi:hypothetical protein
MGLSCRGPQVTVVGSMASEQSCLRGIYEWTHTGAHTASPPTHPGELLFSKEQQAVAKPWAGLVSQVLDLRPSIGMPRGNLKARRDTREEKTCLKVSLRILLAST